MAEKSTTSDGGPYQVVARRFRPRHFDDVVGQDAVVECLKSALTSGRIPHAFMLSGSRGVGKTTVARILARALNCETGPGPRPCDTCRACTSILAGANIDVVEIDAASHNGVDDIRELRDRVGLSSMGSRYKVYILDEVHMLSRPAFNAFLKTLEEPPSGVVFVMATTELHKIPETIRSRSQVHLFRRVDETDITRRLRAICAQEGVAIPDEVLDEIAVSSRGGMRDAEGALERVVPVAQEKGSEIDLATYRRLAHRIGFDAVVDVVGSLLQAEAPAAFKFAADLMGCGVDEREALGEILEVLRALLVLKVDGEDSGLVDQVGPALARLQELSRKAELHCLEAMIHAGLLGRDRIRRLEDRRLVLELTLLSMARAGALPQLGELLDSARSRLQAVPSEGGGSAPSGSAAAPGGSLDLRSRLLTRLQEEHPLLARTIEQCQVTGPDAAGGVHIEIQTESRLHRDRLAADGVQRDLRATLRDLLGREIELSVDSQAVAKPAATPAEPRARTAPTGAAGRPRGAAPGASVQKVVERFDGQILDDDDSKVS